MKTNTINISYTEYDNVGELSQEDANLLKEAVIATESAYAPYSHFSVGAALLLENGVIVRGNNQENAAYPSGICAERVAIFAASANHPNIPVKKIAISARSTEFLVNRPVAPCGACRQVLAEYETKFKKPIPLIMAGQEGKILKVDDIKSVLPLMFSAEDLNL